jgi:predicted dithiol-disulfide oxidoreductase (DUF899 family)
VFATECSLDECIPRYVPRPRFPERTCERKQYRTPCERYYRVFEPNDTTATINDEGPRPQHRLNLLKREEALLAAHNQPRRGRLQRDGYTFHLGDECGDAGLTRGTSGLRERSVRYLGSKASDRDACHDQLIGGPRCWRKGRRIELGEYTLGLVETPDQEQTSDLEMPRMRGVHPVAVSFESNARCVECLRRPSEVTGDQRDFSFGDDAPRAGNDLSWAKGASRSLEKKLSAHDITELGHRDAAQRKGGRVVTQADPLQHAEQVTCGERARRGRDHRVHLESRHTCHSHRLDTRHYVFLTTKPHPRVSRRSQAMKTQIAAMPDISQASTGNHRVVSRDEWLAERKALLAREKELTRLRDRIASERRQLPWVRIDKSYVFDTPEGRRALAELFDGRRQLLVQHFMFGPGWEQGCPSCSFMADHTDGMNVHLAHRDVTFVAISRAPLAEIERFRKRMGWQFKWVSSHGSDFNYDFGVSFTAEEVAKGEIDYNYGRWPHAYEEWPGVSVFCKDDAGDVLHTYSTYGRGVEVMMGAYNMLDLTPKGRDERDVEYKMEWLRHHDRYEPTPAAKAAPPAGSVKELFGTFKKEPCH